MALARLTDWMIKHSAPAEFTQEYPPIIAHDPDSPAIQCPAPCWDDLTEPDAFSSRPGGGAKITCAKCGTVSWWMNSVLLEFRRDE